MWILALDTSTRDGSAAVARDGHLVAAASGDGRRTHGERLPGDLLALARAAGVALSAIDLFAVSSGPGSFTSLRVGIATIQALALARSRPVVPVSTLDALARAGRAAWAGDSPDRILAWMDGRRRDVFAALYAGDGVTGLGEPRVGSPESILDAWRSSLAERRVYVIGDGVAATRRILAARLGPRASLDAAPPPLAPTMARIAFERRAHGAAPHAVRPLYVRRPDAVLARARSRGGDAGAAERHDGRPPGVHVRFVR